MKSSVEYSIRRMCPTDTEEAARLERICLESEGWTAEGIAETLERGGYYLVAESDGKLLGHAGFTLAADEGYITNIAVSPDFRRQMIASRLTEALKQLAECLGASFLSLEVRESNSAAIALYEKSGFETVGRRKNFYRDPVEAALIMTVYFKEV